MTGAAGLTFLTTLAVGAVAVAAAEGDRDSSCVACHVSPSGPADERARAIAVRFDRDVHRESGLSCHDCHGGDPAAGRSGTTPAEMHPSPPDRPFIGRPEPGAIPALCASCHSNSDYMERHRPGSRVNQEVLYRASRHGQALGRGDPMTATCVDCHGAHGIRPASDPDSSVHPTRLATTCGTCHSSQERMAGRKLANGRPMPVDQHARWQASVHAAGLDHGDHASPTCNDCHSDHADLPAGVASLSQVCGSCHLREAELVAASPLGEGFDRHRAFMEEAGEDGCLACHESTEPAARLPSHALSDPCLACHGSHSVAAPTLAMLAPPPEMACGSCHEISSGSGSREGLAAEERRMRVQQLGGELAARGQAQGLAGNDLHDWLLDRAQTLPEHVVPAGSGKGAALPGFAELASKLRIGRTHRVFRDGSAEVREAIEQCTTCHSADSIPGNPGGAYATALAMRDQLESLTSRASEAASLLIAAGRGGVDMPSATCELEEALRFRAELGASLHTFRVGDGTPFTGTFMAALQHADAAYGAGQVALAEARGRRRWLTVWLTLIGAAALVVTLQIREASRRQRQDLAGELR